VEVSHLDPYYPAQIQGKRDSDAESSFRISRKRVTIFDPKDHDEDRGRRYGAVRSNWRQDERVRCLYRDTAIWLTELVTIRLDITELKSVGNASIPRAGIQERHGGQEPQSAGRPGVLPT